MSKCSAALSIKTAIPDLNVAVINCKVILHLSKCSDHICFSTFPVLLSTSNWRKQKPSSDLNCHIIDDDESLVFTCYRGNSVHRKHLQHSAVESAVSKAEGGTHKIRSLLSNCHIYRVLSGEFIPQRLTVCKELC